MGEKRERKVAKKVKICHGKCKPCIMGSNKNPKEIIEQKYQEVLEKVIHVRVDPPYSIRGFVGADWQNSRFLAKEEM